MEAASSLLNEYQNINDGKHGYNRDIDYIRLSFVSYLNLHLCYICLPIYFKLTVKVKVDEINISLHFPTSA